MTMDTFDIEMEKTYPTPYANSPLLPLLLVFLATQKHSPTPKTDFKEEYDYIVVGAGSAGSVVASRLSERPFVTVLLLEAGKPSPLLTSVPAIPRNFIGTDIDWNYTTEALSHTGLGHIDRVIPWPSGKTLGGSSMLNGMIYVRGNPLNYDDWSNLGAKNWSYADVLPYFKKLEDNRNSTYLKNGYHAKCGPITASNPAFYPLKKRASITAVRNEGYVFVDPNAGKQNGFFDLQGSIRCGQRCSTAKGYLVPAENRTNLDIVPNAMVRKVLIEDKEAKGVEFDFNGTTHQVKARREVILSAGTVNSAQLLMLSGIGPKEELEKFGITVIADLDVGLNMQDHPATTLIFEVNDTLPTFDNAIRNDENIRTYIRDQEGPLGDNEGFLIMGFLSNSENGMEGNVSKCIYISDYESILYRQQRFTNEVVEDLLVPLTNKSTISCAVQIVDPKSRGNVTLKSTNPYDQPAINPNYYDDPQDVYDTVQGFKACMKIMNNPAMKEIGTRLANVTIPGCDPTEEPDEYFKCIVKTIVFTTNHQVGTAKMGDPDDPTTVVDSKLRVKGIKGLRVVDASIMPTIPWSNTNIPTIMVAEKASDIIKETIRCKSCETIPCNHCHD